MLTLREARMQDEEALFAIGIATGDAGKDASAIYDEPKILGYLYSIPYLHITPETVFVAEDDHGVCGYIAGALDTASYEERLEQEWWPHLRARYPDPDPSGNALQLTPQERRIHSIHQPRRMPSHVLSDYPAHIHMNLLARSQGKGGGSRLLSKWVEMARAKGIAGIHLGANLQNHDGIAFWQSRGFSPLTRSMPEGAAWFGMRLRS